MSDSEGLELVADLHAVARHLKIAGEDNMADRVLEAAAQLLSAPVLSAAPPPEVETDVLQADLRDMLRALGLPDGARTQSPHEVFQECREAAAKLVNALAADAQYSNSQALALRDALDAIHAVASRSDHLPATPTEGT